MRHMRLILAVLLAMPFAAAVARAENLGDGWLYRRPLNFKQAAASGLPGDNAAWAEFYANGAEKPDGSDLRVTMAERVLVPYRILQRSPSDDFFRIAFATHSDGPYYVWWGNPNPGPLGKPLDIQRGILVQISQRTPGEARDARTADGLQQLLDRSRPLAAFFTPQIFLGYNPLGDEPNDFFHYSSQFHIDKPLTADFAFAVLDSGTLSIDGNPVLHEFRSGWKNKVRESKSLDLTPGWHHIDVTQINLNGGAACGISVVWKKPGEPNFSPLPAEIFAPIAHADAGPLEKVSSGGGATLDFTITPTAESFVPPDGYLQRYAFDAAIPSGMSPKVTWDFGDGEILSGTRHQSHVYLSPGTYSVSVHTQGVNTLSATTRITIKDRMYALFPTPPDDKPKTIQSVLADYDETKLSAPALLRGTQFYQNIQDDDRAIRWGKAWLASKDSVTPDTLTDETQDLAARLITRKNYADAAELYRLACEKNVAMEQRLTFLRAFVVLRSDFFDDATPALQAAMDWQKRITSSNNNQQRLLTASLVYAAIAQGDAKIAHDALDQFAAHVSDRISVYNHAQIRQGVLARNIEAYIRNKDFSAAQKLIDEWEMEFPESIWDGFTRTLRVKLYAAQSLPAVAARIALQHARANPSGFYAAELLYRASQNFQTAGAPAQAKAAMDLLTSKYPESPYARPDAAPDK